MLFLASDFLSFLNNTTLKWTEVFTEEATFR